MDCPTREELTNFINGRVSPSRLSCIADHLDGCTTCSALLTEAANRNPSDRDPLVNRLSKINFVEGQKGPRTSNDPFELNELSRYELIAEVGEGGMGQVFKARHKMMKRTVALKTIRPELLNHPEAVKRFAKEARAAARLSHPNIVTAFDAEQAGDMHLLVMEYVEGVHLAKLVNQAGPLPVDRAIDYTCQASLGLQHAHERKMVHRDIKPQNLMLASDGVIKILDFGLSKFRRDLELGENDSVADETILTLNNTSLGTQGFIAPEQAADARSVDIRSDIYSLGCTMFFMLTNRPPYYGMPPNEPSGIPDVTRFRADLPVGLPEILNKMMAPRPDDRYDSPNEVAEALKGLDVTRLIDVSKTSPKEKSSTEQQPAVGLLPWVIGILILFASMIALLFSS